MYPYTGEWLWQSIHFGGAVAASTGRLIRLQGTVSAKQVQRRIREKYGERETVSRRARYVLRSFIDWGVLNETLNKGVYILTNPISLADLGLLSWLMEAYLHSQINNKALIKEILGSPALFPFELAHISSNEIMNYSSRLNIIKHNLNEDLAILHKIQ